MQSACEASEERLRKILKLHGAPSHSRARNGIEANISYQVTSAEQVLLASRSRCLTTGASTLRRSCPLDGRAGTRTQAKPQIAAPRLCTRDGVLSLVAPTPRELLSPPRFTPLLSASRSLAPSPNLSRPQPPARSTLPLPRSRRTTPPMSSTPLGGLPFCLLSWSGTKAALSCAFR